MNPALVDETSNRPQVPFADASVTGKLVIMYLTTRRTATIDQMKRELALPKLTLLCVLNRLENMDAITHSNGQYSIASSQRIGNDT